MSLPLVNHGHWCSILQAFPEAPRELIAELLGGWFNPVVSDDKPGFTPAEAPPENPKPPDIETVTVESSPVWFWAPVRFAERSVLPTSEHVRRNPGRIHWRNRPSEPPTAPPISPWPVLIPRLRAKLLANRFGHRIDWERTVEMIANGLPLNRLPRQSVKRWGEMVHVIVDRSDRMSPYAPDQREILQRLAGLIPEHGLYTVAVAAPDEPDCVKIARSESSGLVLVLGDLGMLQSSGTGLMQAWRDWGQRFADRPCKPLALVPCATAAVPFSLQAVFDIESWQFLADSWIHQTEERGQVVDRLLALLSPACRIEPGLLRQMRVEALGGAAGGDDSLEADFWQHCDLSSRHSPTATIDPHAVRERLSPAFEREPPVMRRKALAIIRRWRQNSAAEVWLEEVSRLTPATRALLPTLDDWEDAQAMVENLATSSAPADHDTVPVRDFARRVLGRLTDDGMRDRTLGRTWRYLDRQCFPEKTERPPGWDPAEEDRGPTTITLVLRQQGDELAIEPFTASAGTPSAVGSQCAYLKSTNSVLRFGDWDEDPFWHAGLRPAWAHRWGVDNFGCWASFQVGGVEQRMRWVDAGAFRMGSPKGDKELFEDETPPHEVSISRGFWLFDTPCTQGLWTAVPGAAKNLSRFPEDRRPVEQVSHEDALAFLAQLTAAVPGLSLTLPTEAQWEYACRAGTTAPRYGELDEVAWHAGNSSGQTHDVGAKAANPWGLSDMLGDVWEWCLDGKREYAATAVTDPVGAMQSGARRVIRGGGWGGTARSVRAAYRYSYPPGTRYGTLGFRPLSSGDQPVELGRRPRSGVWRAEPASAAERPTPEALKKYSILVKDRVSHPLPSGRPFQLESDCEQLVFDVIAKPEWAEAIGRDKHGLWTTLQVKDAVQKLRWIPPGRFLMGSPANESGRWDAEGPQHWVTISRGYWLFDTPCCQDLYEAVLGSKANESRFRHPRRPVEQVSWGQARDFIRELRRQKPGLWLRLPKEAEWEYACRAGTTTATYAGPMEILGEHNAPILDGIAWYGGNSGRDFDLENGYDSRDWPNKQYQHSKAGSRIVCAKDANAFGLHDMLGNVWEWCQDSNREYTADAVIDPNGGQSGAERVVRGGGWGDTARYVRAAFRYSYRPGLRGDSLGFRPLSSGIREEEEEEPVREAAGAAERSKAASGASAKNSDFAAALGDEAELNAGPPSKRPKKPRK